MSNSTEVLDEALAKIKKSQQTVNRAMARAARMKRRASQQAGGLILEIPPAIRARALRIFDAIVSDEKKLRACERIIKSEDSDAALTEERVADGGSLAAE